MAALTVSFPEFAGMSGEQLEGALRVSNPQRAAAFRNHVAQVATVAAGYQQQLQQGQQQQAAATAAQQQQREAMLSEYTNREIAEYEKWTSAESPEAMRAVRDNLTPIVEKTYGVPMQTLKAIHDGKLQMDATTFVRSAAFQKMLHQAVQYNLAKQGVTQARSNPVAKVQRPGVASEGPSSESDYTSLERSLRGKTLNVKDAASLLTAHRSRR